MASQGWKPGEYLGAKDAPHAEFHTAANASHIRVMIKDDNLGLGAKIGSGVGHGECTGLDAFKNLLGRLNGKDEEEIEKEQKSRQDLKRAIYTERRWGSIRFVQGGFLVGDKIQHLIDGEAGRVQKLAAGDAASSEFSSDSSDSSESNEEPDLVIEKPKKSKKGKLQKREESPEVVVVKTKKSKKKKRKSAATPDDAAEFITAMEDVQMSKKKPKRKREAEADAEEDREGVETKKRKKERREKKGKREEKEKSTSAKDEDSTMDSKKSKRDEKKRESESVSGQSTRPTTKENTPSTPLDTESGRSTPMMQGRHAVRARNIAQKRLASMDMASLNQVSLHCHSGPSVGTNASQIFMIKSQT
jgi:Pin2-interacting protein X1